MRRLLPLSLISLILLFSFQEARGVELKVGGPAPYFTAVDDQGKNISLGDFQGKTVILYFYPKDDTPGCTVEAKGFRDYFGDFQKREVVILGVSYDSQVSHRRFKERYRLPYYLIVDKDKKIAESYGVGGEFFANRETFLIDPEGKILKIYRNVNPSGHAEEILQGLGN